MQFSTKWCVRSSACVCVQCYPGFAALLKVFFASQLIRFRISLSLCWFFCFYGVVRISMARRDIITEPLGRFASRSDSSLDEFDFEEPEDETLLLGHHTRDGNGGGDDDDDVVCA